MNPLGSQVKLRNEKGGQVTRRDFPLRLAPCPHYWIRNFMSISEFVVSVPETLLRDAVGMKGKWIKDVKVFWVKGTTSEKIS